jgi:hypothetical protein
MTLVDPGPYIHRSFVTEKLTLLGPELESPTTETVRRMRRF